MRSAAMMPEIRRNYIYWELEVGRMHARNLTHAYDTVITRDAHGLQLNHCFLPPRVQCTNNSYIFLRRLVWPDN
jgi:hypothetical protein